MIGRTLGTYRIIEKIGMGGMASVYKAYDANTDRHVAVKVLPEYHAKDSEFYERFRREAKAIAKLEHLHILPVHAYGEEDGIAYIVMRYLPTGTLSERIQQGKMSYPEISRLLRQVASALDYAHEQGVLHRDVKPSNVLVDDKGNAYLTDFGLARMIESSSDLTGSNMLGTPQYMSPEQCRGSRDLTNASDIYSLGVVLYEMVTGNAPFQAETPLAVIHMQLSEPLPPPRSLRPDIPEAVENVIYKALAKQPEARHTSCLAMSEAFDKAIAEIPAAPPPVTKPADPDSTAIGQKAVKLPDEQTAVLPKTQMTHEPKPASRFPMWAIVVGVLVVLGVLAALASGVFNPPTPPTPTQVAAAVTDEATEAVTDEATNEPTDEATSEPTEDATPTPTEEVAAEAATDDPNAILGPTQTPTPVIEQSDRVLIQNFFAASVAFSRDGRWLASGGGDSTLRVWDFASGEELISIPLGEQQFAGSLEFSPDGRFLAAGGLDVNLSIASTITDGSAAPISVIPGGVVRGLAFSPDSQYIIFGGDGLVLEVYRVNDGVTPELMHQLEGHTAAIYDVAFSPDGATMATAGGYEDGRVILWDLNTRSSTILDTQTPSVDSVSFSPDGLRLAVSTIGLQIWDVTTRTQIMTVNTGSYTATYSPDGRLIATGHDGGAIGLVNAQTGEEITQLSGHEAATIFDLTFSPDGSTLASAAEDGIRLWSMAEYTAAIPALDAAAAATVESVQLEPESIVYDAEVNTLGVDVSPGNNRIAIGASDGIVRLWSVAAGEVVTLNAGDEMVSLVDFSPSGALLATAGSGSLRIWDPNTHREVFAVEAGEVSALAFSADNQTFAFANADNDVEVWSLLTRENIMTFSDAEAPITGLAFSPNTTQLLVSTGYQDGRVLLYNLDDGSIAQTLSVESQEAFGAAFSLDGSLIAATNGNTETIVWDAATGEQVYVREGEVFAFTFSPDSVLIASGDDSGTITLWDARTGEEVRTFTGHTQRIESLAFNPDNTFLVSTSEDATVRVWDLAGDE